LQKVGYFICKAYPQNPKENKRKNNHIKRKQTTTNTDTYISTKYQKAVHLFSFVLLFLVQ